MLFRTSIIAMSVAIMHHPAYAFAGKLAKKKLLAGAAAVGVAAKFTAKEHTPPTGVTHSLISPNCQLS